MQTISTLLDLLYSARDRIESIQATYRYTYRPGVMDASVTNRRQDEPTRITPAPTDAKPSQRTAEVLWRVWWEKPSRWRYEQRHDGFPPMVSIINGKQWWYLSSTGDVASHRSAVDAPSFSMHAPLSPNLTDIDYAVNEVMFLDPSPLLGSHVFEIVGQTHHLGRDAIRVRAVRRRGRAVIVDPLFWEHADGHELLVDRERGILLRYDSWIGDMVYATASATEVVFDMPLSHELFAVPAHSEDRGSRLL